MSSPHRHAIAFTEWGINRLRELSEKHGFSQREIVEACLAQSDEVITSLVAVQKTRDAERRRELFESKAKVRETLKGIDPKKVSAEQLEQIRKILGQTGESASA